MPLIIGLVCGKWPIKIRHPRRLLHPVRAWVLNLWRGIFSVSSWLLAHGVATIGRLLKITGLFCKRAPSKRRYSAKETYHCKEPTNRGHSITHESLKCRVASFTCLHDSWHVMRESTRHVTHGCCCPPPPRWTGHVADSQTVTSHIVEKARRTCVKRHFTYCHEVTSHIVRNFKKSRIKSRVSHVWYICIYIYIYVCVSKHVTYRQECLERSYKVKEFHISPRRYITWSQEFTSQILKKACYTL